MTPVPHFRVYRCRTCGAMARQHCLQAGEYSPTCDLIVCTRRRCRSWGTLDGRRWIVPNTEAPRAS